MKYSHWKKPSQDLLNPWNYESFYSRVEWPWGIGHQRPAVWQPARHYTSAPWYTYHWPAGYYYAYYDYLPYYKYPPLYKYEIKKYDVKKHKCFVC
ncbi:MAG: hypothetical protein METHAR1v1_240002 [Methanothrix sp.]|nr:MAG: hypothetical protein METHAR1v1_240002 [Methanothrix sp.]